jgi:hypothetical protein
MWMKLMPISLEDVQSTPRKSRISLIASTGVFELQPIAAPPAADALLAKRSISSTNQSGRMRYFWASKEPHRQRDRHRSSTLDAGLGH